MAPDGRREWRPGICLDLLGFVLGGLPAAVHPHFAVGVRHVDGYVVLLSNGDAAEVLAPPHEVHGGELRVRPGTNNAGFHPRPIEDRAIGLQVP